MFRAAARELFGADVPPGPLPLRQLRNADFRELVLEVDGRPALRFAAAYGFRNIQMLVPAPANTVGRVVMTRGALRCCVLLLQHPDAGSALCKTAL